MTLLGVTLGTALGCMNDDPSCDPSTESLVEHGSDVAGSKASVTCEAAPAACGGEPSCECLVGQKLGNGLEADFCLEEGSCSDEGETVELSCPGG